MIYLASPYANNDPSVREYNYRQTCRAVVHLLQNQCVVFSPVVHMHALVAYGLPTGWNFWQRIDREFLKRCDEVVVLKLPGWRFSRGVVAQLQFAQLLCKPIGYLTEDAIESVATLAPGTPEVPR